MISVENKNISREVTGKFDYEFNLTEEGVYLIEIIASAKSWWQNLKSFKSFLNGDNLSLTLDGTTEISTSKSNENNARAAWHGNELKGFLETLLIGVKLKKGKHVLNFAASLKPYLKTIAVSRLEAGEKMTYIPIDNNPAQKGGSRPWLSFATIDLAVKSIFLSARVQKRGRDDDDIKLIIDGETQKNENKKSHRDWFWCGKILNGVKEYKKDVNFTGDFHYLDLWADETPFLEKIELALREDEAETAVIKPYTYRGVNGNEDYNKYDTVIAAETKYWNDEFLKDTDPPSELLDPNLVKAIIFQESRMGYGEGAGNNIMQVGNDRDASLRTLQGELKEYWIHNGREVQLKYKDAKIESSKDSIYWGVRWLYHKAMWIDKGGSRQWNSWREAVKGYGPNNEKYSNNVWDVYQKGVDKRGKTPVKLWLIFVPLALMILSGAYWVHENQGKVYIAYHEEKTGSWLCDNGKSWVEVAVLDGLRLKKARINEVQVDKEACGGLIKDSLKYSYWDLDKDGEYEIMLDGEWNSGYKVKYFLKNKNDGLDLITIKGSAGFGSGQALVAERAHFIWPEKNGKYTFAAEEVVGNTGGNIKILRDLYHFNDQGEIEFYRREIEKFTGDPTKFGVIAEIPL